MGVKIRGFSIRALNRRQGVRDRKEPPEEAFVLETTGGNVILPQSTAERVGESWPQLTQRLRRMAQEKHIPFRDSVNR